ncbi:MAG TPA: hypothetical protein VD999_00980 [Vitreimonas sp.]|nr:hypothetical protein [Vitreimonas sp.]
MSQEAKKTTFEPVIYRIPAKYAEALPLTFAGILSGALGATAVGMSLQRIDQPNGDVLVMLTQDHTSSFNAAQGGFETSTTFTDPQAPHEPFKRTDYYSSPNTGWHVSNPEGLIGANNIQSGDNMIVDVMTGKQVSTESFNGQVNPVNTWIVRDKIIGITTGPDRKFIILNRLGEVEGSYSLAEPEFLQAFGDPYDIKEGMLLHQGQNPAKLFLRNGDETLSTDYGTDFEIRAAQILDAETVVMQIYNRMDGLGHLLLKNLATQEELSLTEIGGDFFLEDFYAVDGKVVAIIRDFPGQQIVITEFSADGERVITTLSDDAFIHAAQLSPDGQHLALGVGNQDQLLDLTTGEMKVISEQRQDHPMWLDFPEFNHQAEFSGAAGGLMLMGALLIILGKVRNNLVAAAKSEAYRKWLEAHPHTISESVSSPR